MAENEITGGKQVEEQNKKVTETDVNYRTVELVFGNPVILGIFGVVILGICGAALYTMASTPAAAGVEKIILPAMTGVSGLATGIGIGAKLVSKN